MRERGVEDGGVSEKRGLSAIMFLLFSIMSPHLLCWWNGWFDFLLSGETPHAA